MKAAAWASGGSGEGEQAGENDRSEREVARARVSIRTRLTFTIYPPAMQRAFFFSAL